MPVFLKRTVLVALLVLGGMVGLTTSPARAAPADRGAATVQTVQYYYGRGYYRGPPRGYYGRPYAGRGYYGGGPRYYARPYYGRRYYR